MTTPNKIYATVLNGHVTMAWSDWREDKTDVEYIRADIHDAEIDALKAENAALHAECDRLTAMLGPQRVLEAEDVTQPGLYAWRKGKNKLLWWVLVEFADLYNPGKGDVESVLCRRSFQNGQKVRVVGCASPGQFIGPIRMPEVSNA